MSRRVVVLAVVGAGLALAAPASAKCGNACLAKKVSALNGRVSALSAKANAEANVIQGLQNYVGNLNNCLVEYPATDYGDPAGSFGFAYSPDGSSVFLTTAIDVTFSGDPVGAWTLADKCNTAGSAPAGASHPLAPHVTMTPVVRHGLASRPFVFP